jgi:hypothetical protein
MRCMPITTLLKRLSGPTKTIPTADISVRHARPDDAEALGVLAKLDSSHAPRGAVLVAEADGELWAAVSIDDGHVIADPFKPSGELAFNLIGRARKLRRESRARRPLQARVAWSSN